MGSVYAKFACDFANAQVGKPCGKTSTYAAELDAIKYFNYPKNGVADSCSIFVNDCVYNATVNPSKDKWTALYAMCEPQSAGCNEAAGCTQAARYFKRASRYSTKCQDACRGDQIFFRKSNGAIYHTGIVVDWDSKGLYVVEGNTNGGKVAKKFYSYGDSKIAGFGHPRYDGFEPKTAKKEEPVKAQPKAPTYTNYKVKTNSGVGLRLRASNSTASAILTLIPNGKAIKVDGTKGNWAHTSYGGYTGYCSLDWLVKV